jgi:uncharacterized protein (TIGR00297 family)
MQNKRLKLFFEISQTSADIPTALLFAFIIAYGSYKLELLTRSGAIATFTLALLIYGFGGWMWTIPILTFFLTSSVLSILRKKKNEQIETHFDKTGKRDYLQVLSNGGAGGILVILYWLNPSELFYIIYVSILAAVCADTWGTEIGTMFKQKTYNIIGFRKAEQGISGGVSFIGTLGGILGAITIALSTFYWVKDNYLLYICIIIFAGFIGSLADSISGGIIQAQHKCIKCSQTTERAIHCGEKTKLVRGFDWITNDIINIICGITGGISGYILFEISQV